MYFQYMHLPVQWFYLEFRKQHFLSHLGKYFDKIGKISAKIHEIGKIKVIFGLGMTPILGLKNGQIKSLLYVSYQSVYRQITYIRPLHMSAMFVVYSVISRNLEWVREWPWEFYYRSVNTVRKSWSCQNEAQTVKHSIFDHI